MAHSQVAEAFRTDHYPIRNLVMLITEQCNLRCDYCYIRKAPRTMTLGTAEQAVRFLFAEAPRSHEPVSITFFGGEPLLAPALIEFIHDTATTRGRAEGRDVSFSMTTNATLITARNAALIERLGIAVRLSLDGVGDAHDRHRRTTAGRGSFGVITRHLERIGRLTSVSVRLTVSPETAAQLPESVQWLVDHGFTAITFSPVTEARWTDDSLGHLLEAQRRLHGIQRSNTLVRINHISQTGRALKAGGPRWGCGAARGLAAVDAEGYLYPCHRFVGYFRNGTEQRIGHVATGFDAAKREYYISANHSSSRQGCGNGLFASETLGTEGTCHGCVLLPVCGGNCMATSEYMTGDPARPHPINRVLAQIEAAAHLHACSATADALITPDSCGVRP